jgi:para-aminobenzoate synthetase component 1
MDISQPFFWMNGVLATDLIEISSDPVSLNDGGFWAVSTTFEGRYIFAKFATVIRGETFPEVGEWAGLTQVWESSMLQQEFEDYVLEIQKQIEVGNVYQVNACRILSTKISKERSLSQLFAKILAKNPAPHASFLKLPDLEIASASPELFIARDGAHIKTSPIKGTRKLSETGSEFSEKDRSENVMIVDLMRNDFGRICKAGTVKVSQLFRSELHPGLEHLVSDVVGEVRDEISWNQIFNEVLAPGSVSGAPKESAVRVIAQNEARDRGPYCGALGWVQGDQSNLSVAIRIFWRTGEILKFGTGAGITWSSDPTSEWEETELKAAKLLAIAGGFRSDRWPFGSGLFETVRVENGIPQLMNEHLDRARKSAGVLGVRIPSDVEIYDAIGSLDQIELGRLRLTFGETFQFSIDPYVDASHSARVGIRILDIDAAAKQHKSFPYTSNLKLLTEARVDNFDEIVIINQLGKVCEGAVSNFVFRIDGFWVTPNLGSGVLPGIIRGLIISAGLAIEAEIDTEELGRASHAFALSALRIAQPISEIAGRKLQEDEISKQWSDKLREILHSHSVG